MFLNETYQVEQSQPQLDAESIINAFNEQKSQLRNGFDALSLVLHLVMKRLGFTFLGCGDANDLAGNQEGVAPEGWNCLSDGAYTFRYKHPKSNKTFIIKNLVLGETLLVHGLVLEDNTIQTLELNVHEFIQEDNTTHNYSNLFNNLNKLISLFKVNIVNKMFPDITSKGEETTTQSVRQQTDRRAPYDPYNDPLRVPNSGRGPRQPVNPLLQGRPYQPPFGIGGDDLNPFPSPFAGPSHGNLVGPQHPGFGPYVRDPYGGRPFNGGRGDIPPPPPGARYDPFGPPTRGTPFGEPDRDDMPPPGGPNYDMFL